MKITKRIFAFTMAVIICVSFCMTHITAINDFYEYQGGSELIYFFDEDDANDSYAYMSCTEWGWDEVNTCDFEAATSAYNVYLNAPSNYYIRAFVSVGVFSEPDYYASDEDIDLTNSDAYAYAYVGHENLVEMDFGIEYFTTHHEMNGVRFVDGEYEIFTDIGPTILIGTSY